MANALYPVWKEQLMQGTTNPATHMAGSSGNGVYVALADTGTYTYSAAHAFYSSFRTSPDIAQVGTEQELLSKTFGTSNPATFDAADVTFTAVTGVSVEALLIFRKQATGSSPDVPDANTNWRLIAYIDSSVTGLPVTPNGGNITITWASGGIFTLSDKRAKHDLRAVGELEGVGTVYDYRYNHAPEKVVRGLLAQEVERRVPAAVIDFAGRKRVNYARAIEHSLRLAA